MYSSTSKISYTFDFVHWKKKSRKSMVKKQAVGCQSFFVKNIGQNRLISSQLHLQDFPVKCMVILKTFGLFPSKFTVFFRRKYGDFLQCISLQNIKQIDKSDVSRS